MFTAYQYIAAGTYDTTYESSYWIRYILGLIAGVLLPSLIPIDSSSSSAAVTRPLLALLGGFSAAVLYRILQRLVEMVEALAEGDSKQVEQARHEAVTARALAQMGEERLSFVTELVQLRDELNAGQSIEQARTSVERLLGDVAPRETGSASAGPGPEADPGRPPKGPRPRCPVNATNRMRGYGRLSLALDSVADRCRVILGGPAAFAALRNEFAQPAPPLPGHGAIAELNMTGRTTGHFRGSGPGGAINVV